MTRQRDDEFSTEFGLWLRIQPEIDSDLGLVTTNIDYMWMDYRTRQWMFIEEKRHGSGGSWSQREQFKIVHWAVMSDVNYRGFHFLVFENTNPDDGKMFWDGNEISRGELIEILRFKKTTPVTGEITKLWNLK